MLVVGVVGWLAWAGLGFRLGFGLGSGVVLGSAGWCWAGVGWCTDFGQKPTLAKTSLICCVVVVVVCCVYRLVCRVNRACVL